MFKNEKEQKLLRKTFRILRANIVARKQRLKTLEGNWQVVQTQYPINKNFPPKRPKAEEIIKSTQKDIEQLQKAFSDIEMAMLKNSQTALSMAAPYLKMEKIETHNLIEINEQVIQFLTLCKNLAKTRMLRKQTLHKLVSLNNILKELKVEIDDIDSHIQILKHFPDSFGVPRPDFKKKELLEKSRAIIQKLQNSVQKARDHNLEKQFGLAQKIIDPLLKQTYPIEDLKQLKINLKDATRIAKNMQERTKDGKEIAYELQNYKEKLFDLKRVTSILEKQDTTIRTKYSVFKGYPPVNVNYSSDLKKSLLLRKRIINTVIEAENYIDNKRLKGALRSLRNNKIYLNFVPGYVSKLNTLSKKVEKRIVEYKKIAFEKEQLAIVNKRKAKLEEFFKEFSEQLQSLKKYEIEYKKNFAGKANYPQLPKQINDLLRTNFRTGKKIHRFIRRGLFYVKNKEYEKALAHFDPDKIDSYIDRDKIVVLSKYRYQVKDILFEARRMQMRKEKIEDIQLILALLQQRRDKCHKFKKSIANLVKQIEAISKKYPAEKGFPSPPFKSAQDAIKKSQYEIEDLGVILDKGSQKFHSGNYDEAIKFLKQYKKPSSSRIGYIEALYKRLEAFIKRMNNKKYIEGFIQKQKWATSPGPWYDKLKFSLKIYAKIEKKLSNSLRESSSIFLFPKVKVEMTDLKKMPIKIAEIKQLLHNIKKYKTNIKQMLKVKEQNAMIPRQKREARLAMQFVDTQQILIEVGTKLEDLEKVLLELEQDFFGPNKKQWVKKEKLVRIFKASKVINDRFQDKYQPIFSVFTNMEASVKD